MQSKNEQDVEYYVKTKRSTRLPFSLKPTAEQMDKHCTYANEEFSVGSIVKFPKAVKFLTSSEFCDAFPIGEDKTRLRDMLTVLGIDGIIKPSSYVVYFDMYQHQNKIARDSIGMITHLSVMIDNYSAANDSHSFVSQIAHECGLYIFNNYNNCYTISEQLYPIVLVDNKRILVMKPKQHCVVVTDTHKNDNKCISGVINVSFNVPINGMISSLSKTYIKNKIDEALKNVSTLENIAVSTSAELYNGDKISNAVMSKSNAECIRNHMIKRLKSIKV